jgi:hypothetical protein
MNFKWIVGGVVGVAVVGFGYYAISPLFRNTKFNVTLPISTVEAPKLPSAAATSSAIVSATNDVMKKDAAPVQVIGTVGHPASGTVRIVTVNGKKYVRYENFKTINGPDIYVYLSKDLGAKDYVSLGKVTATEGNINYEIPATANLSDYKYVLTWCKTFGVLFNSGQIN